MRCMGETLETHCDALESEETREMHWKHTRDALKSRDTKDALETYGRCTEDAL